MLKKIIKEIGSNSSEKKLASYADDTFLGLWAYPNVYSDEGLSKNKIGVEVCDLLVVFNNNVIVFSDKNCTFNHDIDVEIAWRRWFKKSVIASSRQLYGAEKFIREYPNRLFLDKRCTIDFPVEINKNMRFFLIAVTGNTEKSASKYYDNIAVGSTGSLINFFPFNADECSNKPFTVGDIYPEKTFIHIFDETNLGLLFSTLSTITDFINYLCEKERVVRNGYLISSGGEEDTLGLYLLNDGILINNDKELEGPKYVIQEWMWKEYEKSPQAELHNAYRKGSIFWDYLIQNFSRSILNAEVGLGQENDFNSHEIAVRELASESRASRYRLATSFLEKLKQVPYNRRSARLVESIDEKGKFYLFLFLPRNIDQDYNSYRLERVGMMQSYALVVQYKYKAVKKLTIIATEPKNSQGRSEDIMTCQFNHNLNRESRSLVKKLIKEEKILSDFLIDSLDGMKFVEVTPRSKKVKRNELCPCGSGMKYKLCHGEN